MEISTLSAQGQTTVPALVKKYLGLKPNQKLIWKVAEDTLGIKQVIVSATSKTAIQSLRGIASKKP